MHYYQHNIKSFNNATRHLTRVERALYRDLIELYYDTEQPLPAVDFDRLARRVMARTDEERGALEYVLSEFFELTGDVWTHDKCDENIALYHEAKTAKSLAGKASAAARKKKTADRKAARASEKEQNSTGVEQPLNECATNKEPITNNQEPITNKKTKAKKENSSVKKSKLDYSCWPSMPSDQVLNDWLAMRKRLKADVSQTVINRFSKEFHIAAESGVHVDECLSECVTRNWRGFEFDWMRKKSAGYGSSESVTRIDEINQARKQELEDWANGTDTGGPFGQTGNYIDGEVIRD